MTLILGQHVKFSDEKLLSQALTHRSASKVNNERLEFLGDSILSFVITKWLYKSFSNLSEGKLSRIRANLVKGETLAEIARHYSIGDQLILGVGELKSGGYKRSSVLADVVEAVFGAVFIDKGIDYAEKFILNVMDMWLTNVDPNVSDKDAKTLLQEYLQKNAMETPKYILVGTKGKDHLKVFTIECFVKELKLSQQASHRSRKKAEQLAANKLLEKLN